MTRSMNAFKKPPVRDNLIHSLQVTAGDIFPDDADQTVYINFHKSFPAKFPISRRLDNAIGQHAIQTDTPKIVIYRQLIDEIKTLIDVLNSPLDVPSDETSP